MRREHRVHDRVQLPGAGQVVAERLLDHHPPPRLPPGHRAAGVGQPRPLQLPDHQRERLRRHGQVERVVAAGAAGLVQLGHGLRELVERVVVGELAGHEPDALQHLLPHRVPERGPRVQLDRVVGDLREVLVDPVPAGEPDQREAGRQQAAVGQVVDRRQQLLAGQVTGDAEHDQHAGAGHPGDPAVPRIPERVTEHSLPPGGSSGHCPDSRSSWPLIEASISCQDAANFSTASVSSTRITSS